MERLAKRNEGMAIEHLRFATALQQVTEATADTYAVDTNEIPMLNDGLNATARHLEQSRSLLEDEARGWEEGVLEDLKRQRDTLVSMRDMFDRRDKYAKDNIPHLEKRIAANEQKLQGIRNKSPEMIKPGEAEKVEDAIIRVSFFPLPYPTLSFPSFPPLLHLFFLSFSFLSLTSPQDKESIVQQHARGVFINECIRDELVFFQQSQYHIGRLHQEWSQERVKYAELQAENWRRLGEEVESMPVGE